MKKVRLLIFLVFILTVSWVNTSKAQVICNSNADFNNATNTPGTITPGTITISNYNVPAGDNSLLVVATNSSNRETPSSVTFMGNSLTLLGAETAEVYHSALWYLPLGDLSSDLVGDIIVVSGIAFNVEVVATSFQNVDQTNPMDGFTSTTLGSNDANSSLTIDCDPGDKALDYIFVAQDGNTQPILTPGQGQVQEITINNFASGRSITSSVSGEILGGSPVIMYWDIVGTADFEVSTHIAAGIKSAGELSSPKPLPALSRASLVALSMLILFLAFVGINQSNSVIL